MREKIRKVEFKKKEGSNLEFEILPLENLIKKHGDILNNPERPNFHLLIYFTDGIGKHYIDFNEYSYEPGTLLFLSQGRIHQYSVNKKAKGFLILFTEHFLFRDKPDIELFSNFYLFNDYLSSPKLQLDNEESRAYNDILSKLKQQFNAPVDFAKPEVLRSLLRVLLLEIERKKRPAIENLKFSKDTILFNKLKKLLENNFANERKVSFYSNKLFVSEKKLSLLTHQFVGKPIKTFIIDRTVLEIKRQLSYTSHPIKEIGYDLGFDDPTNFNKFFKRYVKITPQQFRSKFQ